MIFLKSQYEKPADYRLYALAEPEEIAQAFDILHSQGKVKQFGVSNHKPMQIELLKKYVQQKITANQLQFSLPVSNMIANGMEVNMTTDGATNRLYLAVGHPLP